MKTLPSLASLLSIGAALLFAPIAHAETLSASFSIPDGGVSSGLYKGNVLLNVSGGGHSAGQDYNDAFYIFANAHGSPVAARRDSSYYQLAFGTVPLAAFNPAQNAKNFLVGAFPAYNPTHEYSFILNTGLTAPSALHFGVSDGNFGDNSGAYRISITQLGVVPEPGSVVLFLGSGFAGAAFLRRRRR